MLRPEINIMKTVRLGIVGMGNMGKFHADYLLSAARSQVRRWR